MADRRRWAEYGSVLLLDLVGAAGTLLISTRGWQTIVTPRLRPLTDDVLEINGRTVDAAPTALALVALAGVVAVLATRGLARTVVGALVALAGLGIVWRSITAASAVSADRARSLVQSRQSGVGVDASVLPRVTVHGSWPVLSAVGGALVLVAGLVICLRGRRWAAMSARYEAPSGAASVHVVDAVDAEAARTRASASLWRALDRGDDPTGDDPGGDRTGGAAPGR